MSNIQILGLSVGCAPCNSVKAQLDRDEIPYTFYDARLPGNPDTQKLKNQLIQLGIAKVPAIWLDGVFMGVAEAGYEKLMRTVQES